MKQRGKLFFFCGKMAAGKSTLAREIARREDAVLVVQDEFLVKLFPIDSCKGNSAARGRGFGRARRVLS